MGRMGASNMGMLQRAGLLKVCLAGALMGVLALSLSVPSAVQAQAAVDESQDAEAKMLFQAGQVAFEAGRFKDALGRWQEAYALSGRPALQYNIGLAFDRLRRDQEALEAFRAYLAWDEQGERAVEVKGRIAAIEEAMAAGQGGGVASPAEAAATVAGDSTADPLQQPGAEPSLTKQWWFWPTVGAVATGVLVGIIAASAGGDSDPKISAPIELEMGENFQALRRAPTAGSSQ